MADINFSGIEDILNPFTLAFRIKSFENRYTEFKRKEDRVFFFRLGLFGLVFFIPVVGYIISQTTNALSIFASSLTFILFLALTLLNLIEISFLSKNMYIVNIILNFLIWSFILGTVHGYLKVLTSEDTLLTSKLYYTKDIFPIIYITVAYDFEAIKIILVNVGWVVTFVFRCIARRGKYDPEYVLLDIYFVVALGILVQFYNYCATRDKKLEYFKRITSSSILRQVNRTYSQIKNAVLVVRENQIVFSNARFKRDFSTFFIEGRDKLSKTTVFSFLATKLDPVTEIDYLDLESEANRREIEKNFRMDTSSKVEQSELRIDKKMSVNSSSSKQTEKVGMSETLGLQNKESEQEGPVRRRIKDFENKLKELKKKEKKKGEFEFLGVYKNSLQQAYELYFFLGTELGVEYYEFLFFKLETLNEELNIKNGLIESASFNTIKAVLQMKTSFKNSFVYSPSNSSKTYNRNDLLGYVLKVQSRELSSFSRKREGEKFEEFEATKILLKVGLGSLLSTKEGADINLRFFRKNNKDEVSINDIDAFAVKENKEIVKFFFLNLFKLVFSSCETAIPIIVSYSLVRFRNDQNDRFYSDGKKEFVNEVGEGDLTKEDYFLDVEIQYEANTALDNLREANISSKLQEVQNTLKLCNLYSSKLKNNFTVTQIRKETFINLNFKVEKYFPIANVTKNPKIINFKLAEAETNKRNLGKLFKNPNFNTERKPNPDIKPTRLQQILDSNDLREEVSWVAIVDRNNGRRARLSSLLEKTLRDSGLTKFRTLELVDGSELIACLYVQNVELKGRINIKLAFLENDSNFVDGLSTIGVLNKICKEKRIQKIFTVCYLSSVEDKLDDIKVENLPDFAIEDPDNSEEIEEAIRSYVGEE